MDSVTGKSFIYLLPSLDKTQSPSAPGYATEQELHQQLGWLTAKKNSASAQEGTVPVLSAAEAQDPGREK